MFHKSLRLWGTLFIALAAFASLAATPLLPAPPAATSGLRSTRATPDVKPFVYSDYDTLRTMVASEVLFKLGTTNDDEKTFVDALVNTEDCSMTLRYDGVVFAFQDGALDRIDVTKSGFLGVRGLQVGMTEKEAVELFWVDEPIVTAWLATKEGLNGMIRATRKSAAAECRIMIYGDPDSDYGHVYRAKNQKNGRYQLQYVEREGGSILRVDIASGKVARYSMIIGYADGAA